VSEEGQLFVEKYSPYRDLTYQIHLRLGLLVNDGYDYRIFCGDPYLAQKCRCSLRSVRRAKAQLVKDGYLRIIRLAMGRQISEYEFIFKGHPIVGQIVQGPQNRGPSTTNRGPSATSPPIYRNKDKRSETVVSQPPLVDISEYEQVHAEGSDDGPARARQLRKIVLGDLPIDVPATNPGHSG
jgi:hypothetical protein